MEKQRLDKIIASTGRWSRREAKELIRQGRVLVDGVPARSAEEKAEPVSEEPPQPEPPNPVKPRIRKREVEILLNGKPVVLPPKENGQPYYVMDLLERSGVDFEKLEGPVRLAVNGTECGFSQAVKDRDSITIH